MDKKYSQRIIATLDNETTAIKNYSCLRNLMKIAAKTFKTTLEEIITFTTRERYDTSASLRSGTFNNYCRTGKVSEYACNIFYDFFGGKIDLEVFLGNRKITYNDCITMLSVMFYHINHPQNDIKVNVFYDYFLSIEDFENSISLALAFYFTSSEDRLKVLFLTVDNDDASNIFIFDEEMEYIQREIAESIKPNIIQGVASRTHGDSQDDSIFNDPYKFLSYMENLTSKVDLNLSLSQGPEYIRRIISAIDKQKEYFGYILKIIEL